MTKTITKQDLEDNSPVTKKIFKEEMEDLKNSIIKSNNIDEKTIQLKTTYNRDTRLTTVVALSNKGNIYNGYIQDQYSTIC